MVMHEGEGPVPGPPAGGHRAGGLLTADLQDEIVRHLASGAFYDEVCEAVGIGKTTFYTWLDRGRRAADRAAVGRDLEPNEIMYMDFAAAVQAARGRAKVHAHATIRAAMPRHWQAAAWYLERTNPARYGRWTRTADEVPSQEDLEDAPDLVEEDDASVTDALVVFARRWVAERQQAEP